MGLQQLERVEVPSVVNKIIYELPMFSTLLDSPPKIDFVKGDVLISLSGYDADEHFHSIILKFHSVFEFAKTYSNFASSVEAYDKVVELTDSKRIIELKSRNKILFESLTLKAPIKHFSLFLDSYDIYNIICLHFEVIDNRLREI